MPFENISDLPMAIKNHLPAHAQEIYRAAFNNAWEEYKDSQKRRGAISREETAHKVAWAAVKKKYVKKEDTWKKKESDK